jgi:DNA-binding MarR family transcriptional regulator
LIKELIEISDKIYFGFTPAFIILNILARAKRNGKNSLTIRELVNQSSLSRKKVYNTLSKLEAKDYIKKYSDRHDRRKIKIGITPIGYKEIKEAINEYSRL